MQSGFISEIAIMVGASFKETEAAFKIIAGVDLPTSDIDLFKICRFLLFIEKRKQLCCLNSKSYLFMQLKTAHGYIPGQELTKRDLIPHLAFTKLAESMISALLSESLGLIQHYDISPPPASILMPVLKNIATHQEYSSLPFESSTDNMFQEYQTDFIPKLLAISVNQACFSSNSIE